MDSTLVISENVRFTRCISEFQVWDPGEAVHRSVYADDAWRKNYLLPPTLIKPDVKAVHVQVMDESKWNRPNWICEVASISQQLCVLFNLPCSQIESGRRFSIQISIEVSTLGENPMLLNFTVLRIKTDDVDLASRLYELIVQWDHIGLISLPWDY